MIVPDFHFWPWRHGIDQFGAERHVVAEPGLDPLDAEA
jgi:hypothetical protein